MPGEDSQMNPNDMIIFCDLRDELFDELSDELFDELFDELLTL